MGDIVTLAEQRIAAPADEVFALLVRGGSGGPLSIVCDRLAVDAVVALQLCVVGAASPGFTILGRVTRVERPHRLEVVHHLPWRGRLRVRLVADPTGGGEIGTRLVVTADLDQAGLSWLIRYRGIGLTEPVGRFERPVGLLMSKSGPGAVFAGACEQVATLATEEVNADGGIGGRTLRLLVGDDATDPTIGVLEARRLVAAGCRTILVATTSATFARVCEELEHADVLVVHTLMNEGGRGGRLCMQLGERPHLQLEAAVGRLMRQANGRRWFLAGNDYEWPRVVHRAARAVLGRRDAAVVGEARAPLGTRDFGPLIERILASGAELIVSSFVGADLVAFERQCHAMGVRDQCVSLALAVDETTREHIGDDAAARLWGVAGYFEQLGGDHNARFKASYNARFGVAAVPLSSISEATYGAIHLYGAAARRAGEDDPHAVARELQRARSPFPRGSVTIEGPETVRQDLYVAEAVASGFEVECATKM